VPTWLSGIERKINNDYGLLNLNYPNTLNNNIIFGENPVTINDLYAPVLAVPPEFRALDPAWSECLLGLDGLWDPPHAPQLVSTEASVGVHNTPPQSQLTQVTILPAPLV